MNGVGSSLPPAMGCRQTFGLACASGACARCAVAGDADSQPPTLCVGVRRVPALAPAPPPTPAVERVLALLPELDDEERRRVAIVALGGHA